MSSASPQNMAGSTPDRILAAGRKLFFEIGFQNVSTDMIVKEASVSTASLYKYYPNMAGLLKAVTLAEAKHFQDEEPKRVASLEELREELIRYGRDLMRFLNRTEICRFSRLMHEEARGNPDIAAEFYASAYGTALTHLEALFAQGIEAGFLQKGTTAADLAAMVIGMWEGIPMVRMHMGLSTCPFPNPQDWAEATVDALLSGVALSNQP